MFIGIANIIPGVSGGTIAVILGIFDKLISTINNFTRNIKKNLKFILPIGLGMGFSILAFSSLLEYCLDNYSLPTNIFFVGLVCGSVPLIYRKAVAKTKDKSDIFFMIISILIVVLASTVNKDNNTKPNEMLSFLFLIKIFFGGILSAAAMIIPGISGSFVMVLLGIYQPIIHAISNIKRCLIDIRNTNLIINTSAVIISLGIGVILGILIISKLISFLMSKYYSKTYFCILGLVIGSIYGIFASPLTYKSNIDFVSIIVSVITFSLGCSIAYFLGDKD